MDQNWLKIAKTYQAPKTPGFFFDMRNNRVPFIFFGDVQFQHFNTLQKS